MADVSEFNLTMICEQKDTKRFALLIMFADVVSNLIALFMTYCFHLFQKSCYSTSPLLFCTFSLIIFFLVLFIIHIAVNPLLAILVLILSFSLSLFCA